MNTLISRYKKYGGILVSVALFLLLDASVLMLNFYTSFEITEDAIGVNLAGRQRMLSQRMTKSLFIMKTSSDDLTTYQSAYNELKSSQNIFDQTFNAFLNGGETTDANGQPVLLNAVENNDAITALTNANNYWSPYKQKIDAIIAEHETDNGFVIDVLSLDNALATANANNLQLLSLMNDLTVTLERVASSKATRLRLIQTIGIGLAVLNFIFIMLHFLRQLRQSDEVIEKARNETTEILDTVREGLFLLDEKCIIGEQYSRVLEELFGTENIAGQSFEKLLEAIGNSKDSDTAKEFISLLFDKKIKENLIQDLNPLSQIEVNLQQGELTIKTRYLKFSFSRVLLETGEISHVLATVQDVTEKVELEKALEKARDNNEQQVYMMTNLLHVNPSYQKEFISNAYNTYQRINNILKAPTKSNRSLIEKTSKIYREVHNFKGEASAIKLEYIESKAHAIEETLEEIKKIRNIQGDDFLPVTVQLNKLIDYTQQLEEMIEKLSTMGSFYNQPLLANTLPSPTGKLKNQIHYFAEECAERNEKEVMLVTSGLDEIEIPPKQTQDFKNLCIQLVKNAITHGIELPNDRLEAEKPSTGRIDLHVSSYRGAIELSIKDDGAGIDYDSIRQRARSMGQWSEDEIDSWDNKRLAAFIFKDGFSTADSVTIDAGRGVGMDAVMHYIRSNRGKITVSSRRGVHCHFVITLPISSLAAEAA